MIKFYTTDALLSNLDKIFLDKKFAISSLTLFKIKKEVFTLLMLNKEKVEVYQYNDKMLDWVIQHSIPITDEIKELATAIEYDKQEHPDDTMFISNNSYIKDIANLYFGEDSIDSIVK